MAGTTSLEILEDYHFDLDELETEVALAENGIQLIQQSNLAETDRLTQVLEKHAGERNDSRRCRGILSDFWGPSLRFASTS